MAETSEGRFLLFLLAAHLPGLPLHLHFKTRHEAPSPGMIHDLMFFPAVSTLSVSPAPGVNWQQGGGAGTDPPGAISVPTPSVVPLATVNLGGVHFSPGLGWGRVWSTPAFWQGRLFPIKVLFSLFSYISVWEGAGGVRDVFPDISSKLFLFLVTNAPAKHSSTHPWFPLRKPDFLNGFLEKAFKWWPLAAVRCAGRWVLSRHSSCSA